MGWVLRNAEGSAAILARFAAVRHKPKCASGGGVARHLRAPMGTLPSIVLRRICDAHVRCAPIGTNGKKRVRTDNSRLPRNIRVQVAEHRLCRVLEEELPLFTKGTWTIDAPLAIAFAEDLRGCPVPDPSGDFCKLFPSLSATCRLQAHEQELIARYEQWATLARKLAQDNPEARDLWAQLVSARQTLAAAIVEAYDEDAYVYALAEDCLPMRRVEPKKVRTFESHVKYKSGPWPSYKLDELEARFSQ